MEERSVEIHTEGPGKDPSLLKSYRPLTILPELSKVFERVLREKIQENLGEGRIFSAKQFGFVEGQDTVACMHDLKRQIVSSRSKYVLVIFLDIAGALDNVQ